MPQKIQLNVQLKSEFNEAQNLERIIKITKTFVVVFLVASLGALQPVSAGVFSGDIEDVEVNLDDEWMSDSNGKRSKAEQELKNYNDSCQSNRKPGKDNLDDWRKNGGSNSDGWGDDWDDDEADGWGLHFQGLMGGDSVTPNSLMGAFEDDFGDDFEDEIGQGETGNPLDILGNINIKSIVNAGKKIWSVLENGKPALDFRKNRAHALPKGVVCWEDLNGWNAPVVKAYKLVAKTSRNKKLFDFKFRVVYMYGGSVNGHGQFLSGITIVPDPLDLSWGKKLDVRVQIPSIVNVGNDRANPVAGAMIEIGWKYNSTFRVQMGSTMFFIRGDSPQVESFDAAGEEPVLLGENSKRRR